MTGERVQTCRSCPAEVIFVPSAKTGRPMILNAKPTKLVVLTDPTMNLHGLIGLWAYGDPGGAEARVVDVFTPHHATCPAAKSWAGHSRANPPEDIPPGVHLDGESVAIQGFD